METTTDLRADSTHSDVDLQTAETSVSESLAEETEEQQEKTYVPRRAVDNFSRRSRWSRWTWKSGSIPARFTLHTQRFGRDEWMR